MAILEVRDKNGNIIEIPAIQGKSAYDYAKDGGYAGTEEEFAQETAQMYENVNQLQGDVTELNSKLGLTIRHEAEYAPPLTIIDKSYKSDNASYYGFTLRYGQSSVGTWKGDTYYISVSPEGKLLVGVQINGAANPTWYEK